MASAADNRAESLAAARRALRGGDAVGALRLADGLLGAGADAAAYEVKGLAQAGLARFRAAIATFSAGIEASGDPIAQARMLTHRARAAKPLGRTDESLADLARAGEILPDATPIIATRAELLQFLGQAGEARSVLAEAFGRGLDDLNLALASARLVEPDEDPAGDIDRLGRHLEAPGQSADTLAAGLAVLGDLLDQAGRIDEAFAAYRRANRLEAGDYDPDAVTALVDGLIAAWTPAAMKSVKRTPSESELPVLIVGMPRSGTSLVEQILACHRDIAGGGEMDDLARCCGKHLGASAHGFCATVDRPAKARAKSLAAAGDQYLDALHGRAGDGASRVTDKQPFNLFLLGALGLMLPRARVIWCRREPLDVALSCYRRRFSRKHAWSYDLENIARLWADQDRLMLHWQRVLTDGGVGMDMLELPYERLVADLEGTTRGALEFLGLDWSSECLRFHESGRVTRTLSNDQVRRPIFTSSVGRADGYAEYLRSAQTVVAKHTQQDTKH